MLVCVRCVGGCVVAGNVREKGKQTQCSKGCTGGSSGGGGEGKKKGEMEHGVFCLGSVSSVCFCSMSLFTVPPTPLFVLPHSLFFHHFFFFQPALVSFLAFLRAVVCWRKPTLSVWNESTRFFVFFFECSVKASCVLVLFFAPNRQCFTTSPFHPLVRVFGGGGLFSPSLSVFVSVSVCCECGCLSLSLAFFLFLPSPLLQWVYRESGS